MLSARAYSFHQKSKLAISLSWVAGYVNVCVLLACGMLVSHATGNATHFGAQLVHKSAEQASSTAAQPAIIFGFLLLMFWLGAVASAFMTEGARRRGAASKYILPIAVEAVLLGVLAAGLAQPHETASMTGGWWLALTGIGSLAMGLQNATVTEISGAVVRTTHLTGVLTDLGLEGVRFFNWYRDRTRGRRWARMGRVLRVSQRHPGALRLLLLASIFASFLLGTALGTLAYFAAPGVALLAPLGFLLFLIFMDWYRPIADVREIDQLADPELQLHGLVKALLPPELGLYRLSHHRANRAHRPPDFHSWAEHVPRHWRVIVLASSPLTWFTSNAADDLRDVAEKMHADGRELVIAGITPRQYRILERAGLTDVLDVENFCPDLEFGIARGIDLVRRMQESARARVA